MGLGLGLGFVHQGQVDEGHLAGLVGLLDLAHLLDLQAGHGGHLPGGLEDVPHLLQEDVRLDVHAGARLGLELGLGRGVALHRLDVHVQLVVQAALQLAALAGQLHRVQGQLLVAGGAGGHAAEVGEPGAAAQFAAAVADAPDPAGLLPGADLLHLHLDVEVVGEAAHEVAEVHALLGGVVEDGLGAVALVLHVAQLHVQAHVPHDAAGTEQGVVLQAAGVVPAVDVLLGGLAQHLAQLEGVAGLLLALHLEAHQLAGQAHHAHVMTRAGLHHHQVAGHQAQAGRRAVEALAGVLEAHLHGIEGLLTARQGHPRQPVEHVQLVAAAGAAIPVAAAACRLAVLPVAAARAPHRSLRSMPTSGEGRS